MKAPTTLLWTAAWDASLEQPILANLETLELQDIGTVFFAALRTSLQAMRLKLVLPDSVATYVVDQITVVTPQDVSVLQPGPVSSLTLVTCFPFYFIGSAPERYIVSASLRADAHPAVAGNVRPNP